MGTTWSAQFVVPAGTIAPAAMLADIAAMLDAVLARMIAALSQWAPDSALSRFNLGAIGAWRSVDPDLAHVLAAGLAIGRASGGAFDPAMGRLTELWGFGTAGPRGDVPSDTRIAEALANAGARFVETRGDLARRTGDVALDFSGIGKGHAVDALAAGLRDAGVADFLVEIGGEFVGAGIRPDAQPWWVELENPPGIRLPPLRIALHGRAVATSGDYRRFIAAGPRRLGHSLDPRTGRPVANGVVSVSVIAADCLHADGWATALTVLGVEDGMAAAARERLAARIVTADGREMLSPALLAMLD